MQLNILENSKQMSDTSDRSQAIQVSSLSFELFKLTAEQAGGGPELYTCKS